MINQDKYKNTSNQQIKIQLLKSKQFREIPLYKLEALALLVQLDKTFDFILIANKNDAFDTLKIADEYSIKISIENQLFSLTKLKSQISRLELFYKYATTDKQKHYVCSRLTRHLAAQIPSEYATVDIAIQSLPLCFKVHTSEIKRKLNTTIDQRRLSLLQSSSITSQYNHLPIPYGPELVKFISENPGIYILNGKMGSGKSKLVTQKLFDHFSNMNLYPILLCAKRTLASMLCNDRRHYTEIVLNAILEDMPVEAFANGVCGVINTLINLPIFHEIFQRSKLLVIEEIEDVLNHCYSRASGDGSIQAKERMLNGLIQQIQRSPTIVVADAFVSEQTIELLREHSNLPIHICSGQSDSISYPSIRYFRDLKRIKQMLIDDLKADKRVIVFTDCARSKDNPKFQHLFNELGQHAKSRLQLDADTVTHLDVYQELQKGYQFVLSSPVITSGVSIETELFDKVYVLSKQTIHPLQLLQSMCRYRKAHEIHLHIQKCKISHSQNTLITLLADTKNSILTFEESARLQTSKTIKSLCDRQQSEINLRKDYTNHLLELLELHQFKVIHEDWKNSSEKSVSPRQSSTSKASKVTEYAALMEHKSPDELRTKDYFVFKLLIELRKILHIESGSSNKFNQLDIQSLVEWLRTKEFYLSNGQDKSTAIQILETQGCYVDLKAKKPKSTLNRIASHFFGLKSKEINRGKLNGNERVREYEFYVDQD